MLTRDAFERLKAEEYRHIPMCREVFSDLDTPLSVYLKLVDAPMGFLFESVQGGEHWGRYSIIGLPADEHYVFQDQQVTHVRHGQTIGTQACDDAFAFVANKQAQERVAKLDGLPDFIGGYVGYFGFECIQAVEPSIDLGDKPDPLNMPTAVVMRTDRLAVFDNRRGKLFLVTVVDAQQTGAFEQGERTLAQMTYRLRQAGHSYPEPRQTSVIAEADFVSSFTRDKFIDAVKQSKEYIAAGDVFQVVLSQRLSVQANVRPMDVYRALRALNPSPYMYFMDLGMAQIVGSSPEILVRAEDDTVTVRPIAGTRPRGQTEAEDAALAEELLADEKERAEHVMLIDLGRNDVGRVAKPGSVQLVDDFTIERYSHVMHIVSEVQASKQDDMTNDDVLRSCFPAGTVSGAPKKRALEIILDLEPVKRGVYSGAVGYLDWYGDMDTAIAIRTAIVKDGGLHVQAGAGVVYDSDPEKEWEETMNKARAIFRAVERAAQGL